MRTAQEAVNLCLEVVGQPIIEVDKDILNDTILELRKQHIFVVHIDPVPIRDLKGLLNAFYEKCYFPEWFGFNEAALKDFLLDFSWLSAPGYIFLFTNIHQLDEKTLRSFLRHFAVVHLIQEEKYQTIMKLLLLSDPRNNDLKEIIVARLNTYPRHKNPE